MTKAAHVFAIVWMHVIVDVIVVVVVNVNRVAIAVGLVVAAFADDQEREIVSRS